MINRNYMKFEDWLKVRNGGDSLNREEAKVEWALWEAIDDCSRSVANGCYSPADGEALIKALAEYRTYIWGDGYEAGYDASSTNE